MPISERAREAERLRALLAEQEASGRSVAAFSRERGLNPWCLYDLRRRQRRRESAKRRVGEPPAFVPVQLIGEPAATGALEVVLGHGRRIQVPCGFDERELRRLVEVLESC